jgi:hypothetical protein
MSESGSVPVSAEDIGGNDIKVQAKFIAELFQIAA